MKNNYNDIKNENIYKDLAILLEQVNLFLSNEDFNYDNCILNSELNDALKSFNYDEIFQLNLLDNNIVNNMNINPKGSSSNSKNAAKLVSGGGLVASGVAASGAATTGAGLTSGLAFTAAAPAIAVSLPVVAAIGAAGLLTGAAIMFFSNDKNNNKKNQKQKMYEEAVKSQNDIIDDLEKLMKKKRTEYEKERVNQLMAFIILLSKNLSVVSEDLKLVGA